MDGRCAEREDAAPTAAGWHLIEIDHN